jgi:hypothetical protein
MVAGLSTRDAELPFDVTFFPGPLLFYPTAARIVREAFVSGEYAPHNVATVFHSTDLAGASISHHTVYDT